MIKQKVHDLGQKTVKKEKKLREGRLEKVE
jgi:hypothetical protein